MNRLGTLGNPFRLNSCINLQDRTQREGILEGDLEKVESTHKEAEEAASSLMPTQDPPKHLHVL